MNKQIEVFDGDALRLEMPDLKDDGGAPCSFYGYDCDGRRVRIPLTPDLLSQHMMLIGSIGTGKTNAFNQIVRQIGDQMTADDVMIIFDTKSDFRDLFFRPGIDVIIGNDSRATGPQGPDYWNLFLEIEQDEQLEENIIEMTKTIFAERLEKTSQIFFPNAAKDLLGAMITYLLRFDGHPTNETLKQALQAMTPAGMLEMLLKMPEMTAMRAYIDGKAGPQQMGVLSELQSIAREILIGSFGKRGTLAMRQLVREKKGRRIFITYDLRVGQALTPIYRLLFDLAIKEALGRKKSEGNVWLIADEFRLLPKLAHVGDAVNFGRGMGVKFVIGIQNIEQVYEAYGQSAARSILSGFMTKVVFYLNDPGSRQYIIDTFGRNRKMETYMSRLHQKGLVETVRDANVVEDWNITNLRRGEAILALPYREPFLFKFEKYG